MKIDTPSQAIKTPYTFPERKGNIKDLKYDPLSLNTDIYQPYTYFNMSRDNQEPEHGFQWFLASISHVEEGTIY